MKLSELLERLEEDAERDAMLAQTVKNPDTGQDITVKTALAYDKNHPARKAAAKIYAQFMAKKSAGKPTQAPQQGTPQAKTSIQPKPTQQTRFTPRPKSNYRNRYRSSQYGQRQYNPYGDDGYDAMRDRGAEMGTWGRNRYDDPYYDPQDYR